MTIKFTIEDILHIVERQLDLERDTIKVGDDLQEQPRFSRNSNGIRRAIRRRDT